MFGWLSAASSAPRGEARERSGSSANSSGSTLIATSRLSSCRGPDRPRPFRRRRAATRLHRARRVPRSCNRVCAALYVRRATCDVRTCERAHVRTCDVRTCDVRLLFGPLRRRKSCDSLGDQDAGELFPSHSGEALSVGRDRKRLRRCFRVEARELAAGRTGVAARRELLQPVHRRSARARSGRCR